MENHQPQTNLKRGYSRIPLQTKKLLIKMIIHERQSISGAMRKLNIKLTTARLILQKYLETGKIPMRKFKKTEEKARNTSQIIVDSKDKAPIVKKQKQHGIEQSEGELIFENNNASQQVQYQFFGPYNLSGWYFYWPYGF